MSDRPFTLQEPLYTVTLDMPGPDGTRIVEIRRNVKGSELPKFDNSPQPLSQALPGDNIKEAGKV